MEAILELAGAADGGTKLSEYIEAHGISVNITGGPFENSALLEASARQLAVAVTNLVYEGADLCATNIDGDTPLIIASRLGCAEVVNILLENGCISVTILNKKNFYGRSALFEACTMGHVPVVKILMDALADPVASDNFHNTCLMQACRICNIQIVKDLLHLGVNPSIVNDSGETALLIACQGGDIEIAKLLIEYKASTSVKDKIGNSVLMVAARAGHRDLVSTLLKRGVNFTEANKFGETALLAACLGGDVDTVRTLLSKTRNFRSVDANGNSPLICAICSGNHELVRYLCEHNEAVGAKNSDGDTALHIAAQNGYSEIIACLIGYGAGVSARNNSGMTPLLYAARNGHLGAMQALMAGRANVASRSANGNTPFLEAAFSGHLDVIKFLAKNEADIHARNMAGMNAMHVAALNDKDEAAGFLSELGVAMSALTEDGDTPLLLACRFGFLKVTSKLISLGADPHIRDRHGNSLLLIAAARGHSDVVDLLFKRNLANVLDENDAGNNALMEAAINEHVTTALVLLRHGAEFTALSKSGKSSYQYCVAVPGLLSKWWVECAESIVVTGATGPCAAEINGLYDPVSINASDCSFLDVSESSVNFGDDNLSHFQYVKRPDAGFSKCNHSVLTKMKMTSSGIVIKRSSYHGKKSKIFARLNYRGGLPENNRRKRWEVSQDTGLLWTKFEKQDSVKVWSKSQIVEIVTDDSVEDSILLEKLNVMKIRLGNIVSLLELPAELRLWSNDEILRYMHDGVDMFRMKVMLVGPHNRGKRSLFDKLTKNENEFFVNDDFKMSSEGAVTTECVIGDITFSFWDLGYVKAYSNVHSFFFDPLSVYLLVWNSTDCDVDDIENYIQTIRNAASYAPIIIVSIHVEQNSLAPEESVIQGFDDKYGNIWSYVHVGLRTNEGLSHLKDEIVRVASEQPSVHQKIPKKLLLLQEELDRLRSEEERYYIQAAEFYKLALEKMEMTETSATHALELFGAWGQIYILSNGFILLQPRKLVDVMACLFSQGVASNIDSDPVTSGILYHSELTLGTVWKNFDPELYPQFLNLLYDHDLAYTIRGRNGALVAGHGVTIIPELMLSSRSSTHEQDMLSNLFPEDISSSPMIRFKFSFIPSSYFAKLQCRCGFMTLVGSSWRHGFAVELAGREKTRLASYESHYDGPESTFALVCIQPRHQTISLYPRGVGTSAASAVLHAMVSLRESSFPFMELEEIDFIDENKEKSGLDAHDTLPSAKELITEFEVNLFRGSKNDDRSDTGDHGDELPVEIPGRYDPLFMSTNTSLNEEMTKLGFLGRQSRVNSAASVSTTTSMLRLEECHKDKGWTEDALEIIGSNAVSIGGEDLLVSDDLNTLFDLVEILDSFCGKCLDNIVTLDVMLAKCTREVMSYSVMRNKFVSLNPRVIWVGFRTNSQGELGDDHTHVTLCPVTPGSRLGSWWELVTNLKITLPKAQFKEASEGVLKGLSDFLQKLLLHLLRQNDGHILDPGCWVGLADFSAILKQLLDIEVAAFEKISRPPYEKSVYLLRANADLLRTFPHTASDRLLYNMSAAGADVITDKPPDSIFLKNDPMFKLLYDFVHEEELIHDETRPILKSALDDITSFELAQDLSLTASPSLMRRMSGFDQLRVGQMRDMQHREYPTTFILIDSALIKQSFLSLNSAKTYARQAAVRRMKEIFSVLGEPLNCISSRCDNLLSSSMHMFLLCECCLQPQTGRGVQKSNGPPGSLKRQASGAHLLRQGSSSSRQGISSFNRQISDSFGRGGSFSRQGSSLLGRQRSNVGDEELHWPIKIKSPKDRVVSFLPLALTSFSAAITVNGTASVGRLFGLASHVVSEEMLPLVSDLASTLAAPKSSKDFEAMQEKVRLVTSKNSPALNFCTNQFGLFLTREDPESSWAQFLCRRVAKNGDVVFVCSQCIAAFNN